MCIFHIFSLLSLQDGAPAPASERSRGIEAPTPDGASPAFPAPQGPTSSSLLALMRIISCLDRNRDRCCLVRVPASPRSELDSAITTHFFRDPSKVPGRPASPRRFCLFYITLLLHCGALRPSRARSLLGALFWSLCCGEPRSTGHLPSVTSYRFSPCNRLNCPGTTTCRFDLESAVSHF